MKPVKYAVMVLAVIVVGLFTAPHWGGCKIAYQVCTLSCDIRYIASDSVKTDMSKASCKASCAADRLNCQAR